MNFLTAVYPARTKTKTKLNSAVHFFVTFISQRRTTCHFTVGKVLKPATGRKDSVIFLLKIETLHADGDCSPQWEAAHFHS